VPVVVHLSYYEKNSFQRQEFKRRYKVADVCFAQQLSDLAALLGEIDVHFVGFNGLELDNSSAWT